MEVRTTLVKLYFLRKGILVDLFLSLEKNESRRDKMERKYEVAIILLRRGREKLFLGNLLGTKSSVVNRAMFVYPKLTRAEVERVINTQHRGKSHLKLTKRNNLERHFFYEILSEAQWTQVIECQ